MSLPNNPAPHEVTAAIREIEQKTLRAVHSLSGTIHTLTLDVESLPSGAASIAFTATGAFTSGDTFVLKNTGGTVVGGTLTVSGTGGTALADNAFVSGETVICGLNAGGSDAKLFFRVGGSSSSGGALQIGDITQEDKSGDSNFHLCDGSEISNNSLTMLPRSLGTTFSPQYLSQLYAFAYGNGVYVRVVSRCIYTSTDSINWVQRTYPLGNNQIYGIEFGNGVFVATTYYNSSAVSSDGINWTVYSTKLKYGLNFTNGKLVSTIGNYMNTSPDGVTWTASTGYVSTSTNSKFYYYSNRYYTLVFDNIYYSTNNGESWATICPVDESSNSITSITSMAIINGLLVITTHEDAYINTIVGGNTFRKIFSGQQYKTYSQCDIIIVYSYFGFIYVSNDGAKWKTATTINSNINSPNYAVTIGDELCLCGFDSGMIRVNVTHVLPNYRNSAYIKIS